MFETYSDEHDLAYLQGYWSVCVLLLLPKARECQGSRSLLSPDQGTAGADGLSHVAVAQASEEGGSEQEELEDMEEKE